MGLEGAAVVGDERGGSLEPSGKRRFGCLPFTGEVKQAKQRPLLLHGAENYR